MLPFDATKTCPKCDASNVSTPQKYIPQSGLLIEHLEIRCAGCGYRFDMHVKTPEEKK